MAKKKFTDGENPTLQFLTQPQEEKEIKTDASVTDIPEGYKLVPESKSKRINLLMRPSLHKLAQERATKKEVSLSEYIHLAVEEYIANGN